MNRFAEYTATISNERLRRFAELVMHAYTHQELNFDSPMDCIHQISSLSERAGLTMEDHGASFEVVMQALAIFKDNVDANVNNNNNQKKRGKSRRK